MAKFYGLKIRAGERALEDVPKLWKAQVEIWLKENQAE